MNTLIRNGAVVTARESSAAARLIDATGMYVIPGGIDAHTHLDMPFGGATSIVDFAIQARGTRMRDALDTWWKKAEGPRRHRLRPAHDRHRPGRLRPGRYGRHGGRRHHFQGPFRAPPKTARSSACTPKTAA
jgi:dihydroorotase-like cyclic amidohydrolase